ncbi:MAG: LysM peptidoglycan-binding domain-containing protein [Pseudomonadota bacterium]
MRLNHPLCLAVFVAGLSSASIAQPPQTAPAADPAPARPALSAIAAPAPTTQAVVPALAKPVAALIDAADAAGAEAENNDRLAKERKLFHRPDVLKGNIKFWRRVFGEYSEHQSVIHDIRKPERIYTVLDFRGDVDSLPKPQLSRLKNDSEDSTKARIAARLRETAALAGTPELMDAEQRQLAALFSGDEAALADAASNIRTQRGLQERTRLAVEISGQYLPEMERIFADAGLPRLLTRLPIVESSFNINAYSKVAAAGLWQFMPSSAKMYMRHNQIADERRDPWTSTRAAAGHLKDDFDHLGSWPLALTAYNYGRGGVARALKESNSSTLDEMLVRFNGPRFGFASRNFYAEFLAATDVERDYRKYFGEVQRKAPIRFDTVTVDRYTPYRTLLRTSGLDEEQFRELNPSYHAPVVSGRLHVPAGDTIRLPAGKAAAFNVAYSRLGSSETFARQRQTQFNYRVKKGESLAAIAQRYGTSEGTLRGMNGLKKKSKLRAGRILRIPNNGDDVPEEVAEALTEAPQAEPPASSSREKAAKSKKKSVALAARTHKVKPGQTLSGIAAKYNVSVASLKRENDLPKSGAVRIGMKLKIPS